MGDSHGGRHDGHIGAAMTNGDVLRHAAASGVALGSAAVAWALFEARWYALRWTTVPALPPTARPLRVLHLSDLHLLPGQTRVQGFLRSCLDAGPDMVVLTGDILGHGDAVDDAVAVLAPLAEGRPALFTLGSNDFYAPVAKSPLRYFDRRSVHVKGRRLDTDRLVQGLVESGWTCAENRRMGVETAAGVIDVLGLGDAHVEHDDPRAWREPDGAGAPVLRLGVAHAPYLRVLETYADHGVGLVLAGHTHGGQVRMPGVGALVDNCDLPLGQARGLSAHTPSMWLHVSAGLGTNRYTPVRFACRPEASIVDVVGGPARRQQSGPPVGKPPGAATPPRVAKQTGTH